ncbi:hypothetical protein THAOC_28903, partial [Thalassiosira oceanica]
MDTNNRNPSYPTCLAYATYAEQFGLRTSDCPLEFGAAAYALLGWILLDLGVIWLCHVEPGPLLSPRVLAREIMSAARTGGGRACMHPSTASGEQSDSGGFLLHDDVKSGDVIVGISEKS